VLPRTILLGNNVPIIEVLDLDEVKGRGIFFACLPIKLYNVDEATARAIAIEF